MPTIEGQKSRTSFDRPPSKVANHIFLKYGRIFETNICPVQKAGTESVVGKLDAFVIPFLSESIFSVET